MRSAWTVLGTIGFLIVVLVMGMWLFRRDDSDTGLTVVEVSASPSPGLIGRRFLGVQTTSAATRSATPTPFIWTTLPENWTRHHDDVMGYEFAYPDDWAYVAANSVDESSILYSFNPRSLPKCSPVPLEELVIRIQFYPNDKEDQLRFNQEEVYIKSQSSVGPWPAVRRHIKSGSRYSIVTTVETNSGTYAIWAEPSTSDQIGTYHQFLSYLEFDESPNR